MTRIRIRPLMWSLVVLALTALPVWAAEAGGPHEEGGGSMTHRMMVLAIQLGVILFVAKLSGGLFEKLSMPGVLGEIAGGLLVGPYLLGSLPLPAFPHGLFPIADGFPVSPELYGFCSVAAIVLLFETGLETDVASFMRYSVAGVAVGLGGVIASFGLGAMTAVWFSHWLLPERLSFFSPPAIFLGVMSTATSVGITARILSEKGKIDSPEGVTILAGAVIDDVLGIILLAVAVGMISASEATGAIDWGRIAVISAKAVFIWLAATGIGLVASHQISLLLKLFRDRRTIALMAFGLCLILAGLFEEAGLAMIIGAYVAGLSLSRTDICHLVREKLEPISAFLVPVFFVVMGMLVDVRLITSPGVLAFGAVYTALAVTAKLVGCAAAALPCGFSLRGALRVGAGMLPRGEVALIVGGIGLAAGAVGKELFGVGVLMTLVTTLIAPPLLVALLRNEKSALRDPSREPTEVPLRFSLPSAETAELLARKVLDVFEDDGFFVHALNGGSGLYQMRKHDSVVSMRYDSQNVVFTCTDRDRFFVHTAVLEVVSDLRRTAAELAKPIDRSLLAAEAGTGDAVAPAVSLSAHIDPQVLTPQLTANNKPALLEELLELAARSNLVRDRKAARDALMDREAAGSTGMQNGIALPHALTGAVDQIVCAIGLKPEGIDFDSLDGEPSRVFVLVLSPAQASGQHLRFLATVGQVFDDVLCANLLRCRTAQEMYSTLVSHGDGMTALPRSECGTRGGAGAHG